MRKAQRGVTFIGWLVLLAPVAILVYAGIRLAPIYLNYFRVVRALEQLATETKGDSQVNPTSVRQSLEKRFDVEYVDHPSAKEIEVRREGDHWVAVADYEDLAPLLGNVSILVQFSKQVELQ
jgi:Domain of unknown function (DUF4845)